MKVIAELKYLRIAPRKVRLVAGLVKGLPVEDAREQLRFLRKRSSRPLMKLIDSAVANAEHNFQLDKRGLVVSSVIVNEGPTLKRFMPRAMGRATSLHKRSSHIRVELEDRGGTRTRSIKKKSSSVEKVQAQPVEKKQEIVEDTKIASAGVAEKEKKFSKPDRFGRRENRFRRLPGFTKKIFRRKSV